MTKFDELYVLNNQPLTKKYIESLSKQERLDMIEPLFNLIRANGLILPDDFSDIQKEYKSIVDYQPDMSTDIVYNNSSLGTSLSKLFCREFYEATEPGKKTLFELWEDDVVLKKLIHNRLGLGWIDETLDKKTGKVIPGVNESFNLSPRMCIQRL